MISGIIKIDAHIFIDQGMSHINSLIWGNLEEIWWDFKCLGHLMFLHEQKTTKHFHLIVLSCVVCPACGCHCSGKTPRGSWRNPTFAVVLAKATTAASPGFIPWHIPELRAPKRTCWQWRESTKWGVTGARYYTNRVYGTGSSVLPHTCFLPLPGTLNLMVSLSSLYRGV